jgi:ATP-dependent exoDNAse (exonuclease V) alpha subunit
MEAAERTSHRRVTALTLTKVERFGWTFPPGDKVMQIENDYDKEVYNGDIGYVDDVDPGRRGSSTMLQMTTPIKTFRSHKSLQCLTFFISVKTIWGA